MNVSQKNEHNKMPVDLKPSKHVPVPHFSKRDVENQHPGSLETVQKAPVRAGVSRLPVLAKSFHLQTPSDFTHSHKRWEEKPLAGKAKQKRPCTKPVPFNLSQPKSTRMATQNQTSLSRTGTHVVQTKHILSAAHPKTKNLNGKLSNCPAVVSHSNGDSTQGAEEFQRNRPSGDELVGSYVPGDSRAREQRQNLLCLSGKGEAFQPDHAALLSILRDEGVSAMDPQTYMLVYFFKGPAKSVQFSPDPAALRSILQNEGVKAGGPLGATPQNAVCPSGRGTSIYTWVRYRAFVVLNLNALLSLHPSALKETPVKKWTPQRVPDTRHQPMSAMASIHVRQSSVCVYITVSPIMTLTSPSHDVAVFRRGCCRHTGRPSPAPPSCAQSPAVALLRRRLPPLEELRMDEEVATYTSVSAPAPSGFLLPRPRCGNPLASILHFQEATPRAPFCVSSPLSPLPFLSLSTVTIE
uniref:Uncharacterized LOC115362528 n=1 Tax=Myripristis murdjan TaxID=586833 RepID=A0A667ZYF3_9TELE